jgi:hypothetical protein
VVRNHSASSPILLTLQKTRLSLHVAGVLVMAVFASTRRSASLDFGLATVKSWKRKSTDWRPLFKP